MAFWNDLSRFAGNITGGLIGESDDERKKKEELKRLFTSALTVYRSDTVQVFRLTKMQTLLAAMPIRLSPLMTKHISNRLNMSSRAIKLRLKRLIKQ